MKFTVIFIRKLILNNVNNIMIEQSAADATAAVYVKRKKLNVPHDGNANARGAINADAVTYNDRQLKSIVLQYGPFAFGYCVQN
jgi:hypothetical protein